MRVEDLFARALFYEFTAYAHPERDGASWWVIPEEDRAGWRRVAEYVARMDGKTVEEMTQ